MQEDKMITAVKKLHSKFNIEFQQLAFSTNEKEFRAKRMKNKLTDYKTALSKEEELLALVDLVIFAIGTAEREGLINVFQDAFDRVMQDNMSKNLHIGKNDDFPIYLKKKKGADKVQLKDLTKHIEPHSGQLSLFDYIEKQGVV